MQWSLSLLVAFACLGVVSAVDEQAAEAKGKQVAHTVKGKVETKVGSRRLQDTAPDDTPGSAKFEDDGKVETAMKNAVAKMTDGKAQPGNIKVKSARRAIQARRLADAAYVVTTDYEVKLDPLVNFTDVEAVYSKLMKNTPKDVDALLETELANAGATYTVEVTKHQVLNPVFDDQDMPSGDLPPCHDFSESDISSTTPVIKACAYHVIWAKNAGIDGNSEWYKTDLVNKYGENGTSRNSTLEFLRFQCELYGKSKDGVAGDGHQCIIPTCSPIPGMEEACPGQLHAPKVDNGMPAWLMWMLIIGGVILAAALALCVYYALNPKTKAPKKRAIQKKVEPVAPTPAATTSYMMPVYYAPQPPVTTSVTTAAPVYVEHAAPVTYAAPSVSYAAPLHAPASMSYAAPVTYAAPVGSASYPVQYAGGPAYSAFDMIDANHDGTITREEFAYAMQHGS